jgi:hypothetical protein
MKVIPALLLVTALLWADNTSGQTDTNTSPVSVAATSTNSWSVAVSVNGYLVPESRDYVQPTVAADHGWLHVEARYNYENLETGSIWGGYNFGSGEKLAWEFTPMLGGVFGNTTGIAPGYHGSLDWWKLSLYSEGEFLVDTGDSSGDYFYNWSELSLAPVPWLRFGLVTQRTRAYRTDLDIQRGFLAGVSFKKLSVTAYIFNPDESKPTFVLATALEF